MLNHLGTFFDAPLNLLAHNLVKSCDHLRCLFACFCRSTEGCPSFENADSLTQTELFKRLVHPCRFDRIQRPQRESNKRKSLVDDLLTHFFFFSTRRQRKSFTSRRVRSCLYLLSSELRSTRLAVQDASASSTSLC